MTEWPLFALLEWQIMTGLTLLSAVLGWWTKRRWMQIIALGGISVLILSVSLREPVRPVTTLSGIIIGSSTLLWMAKKILEPEKRGH